jgi:hypothetical protein
MSYFKKRERIFASLDADRVDPATFVPESKDHPCFVLVAVITLAGAEAMSVLQGDSPADNIRAMASGAAVIIERLEGRWDYYPGGGADWPQRWADADHEGRCAMAREFAAEELVALASASQRKTTLTDAERKES